MTSSAPGAVVDTLRDVVPGVHMVTHGFTSCFVVEDADPDAGVTLVDAAFPSTWTAVRRCLAELGRSAAEVRGLVLTHGHFDHVGFARKLQRAYGVPVWAHADDAHLVEHPYRYRPQQPRLLPPLRHPRAWPVLGSMVAAGALRVPGLRADHLVGRRTILDLPGRPVLVPTPGHTDGELVVHLPDRGVVLTGDALVTLDPYSGLTGPRVVSRAATHDAARALASLDAVAALDATIVLPGHGVPWTQGAAAAVEHARAVGAA